PCGSFRIHNRLAGQFLGHITGIRERLLGKADRPLDEIVLELDADLAQVVADRRVRAEGDEPAVALDVDVVDAGTRQLLGLAFPADRAAAIPGEGEVRPEDAAALQPLAAHRVARRVDQAGDPGLFDPRLIGDTDALR